VAEEWLLAYRRVSPGIPHGVLTTTGKYGSRYIYLGQPPVRSIKIRMRRSLTEQRWIRAGNAKVSCEISVLFASASGGGGGGSRAPRWVIDFRLIRSLTV